MPTPPPSSALADATTAPGPPADAHADDASPSSADASDDAPPAPATPCRDAGAIRTVDVFLRVKERNDRALGPVVDFAIDAPAIHFKVDLGSGAGPLHCQSRVVDRTMSSSCTMDDAITTHIVDVTAGAIIVSDVYDTGAVAVPTGANGPPHVAPPPTERARTPWPCGARPVFHPKSYSNIAP